MPPALGRFKEEVVVEFMRDRDLSITEAADLMGINPSTLGYALTHKRTPLLSTSRLMAAAMEIPVGDLWED